MLCGSHRGAGGGGRGGKNPSRLHLVTLIEFILTVLSPDYILAWGPFSPLCLPSKVLILNSSVCGELQFFCALLH